MSCYHVVMKRTQIQLTENQMESLRIISISHKKPVAELVHDSVQAFLDREAGSGDAAKRENARRVVRMAVLTTIDTLRPHSAQNDIRRYVGHLRDSRS